MRRCGTKLIFLLGAVIAQLPAHAFFDDFLGDHLNSNWSFPTSGCDFHVAESNLIVTKVVYGGGEDYYSVFQSATGYGDDYDQADFSARIKVSFTPGNQVFLWTLGNFFGSGYGYMQFQLFGYSDRRYLTFLLGGGWETSETLKLDPSGTHEFRIDRSGLRVFAYVDGVRFFTSRYDWYPAGQNAVTLSYAGSFENAPFSVDYVSVEAVPESQSLILTLGLLSLLGARRHFSKR
jgi:hypothetical protein